MIKEERQAKLQKIVDILLSGERHPDYSPAEDAVRCRDCKCHVHLCTATRANGFDINGEYLCSICSKDYDYDF